MLVTSIIREQFRARITPPELVSHVPVPIKVGDKNMLVGVSISQWQVPPELNAIMLDLAREEAEQQKEAAAAEAEKQGEAPAKTDAAPEAKTTPATAPSPEAKSAPKANAETPEKPARP